MPPDQPGNPYNLVPVFQEWAHASSVHISGCSFSDAHAFCPACSGGAVWQQSGQLVIDNSQFTHCTAGLNGGAIHLSGSASSRCTGCVFRDNTAGLEGRHLYSTASALLHLDTSTFDTSDQGLTAPGGNSEVMCGPMAGEVVWVDSVWSCPAGSSIALKPAYTVYSASVKVCACPSSPRPPHTLCCPDCLRHRLLTAGCGVCSQ